MNIQTVATTGALDKYLPMKNSPKSQEQKNTINEEKP